MCWTQQPPLALSGGHPVAALGAGHLVLYTPSGDVAAVRAENGARAWVRRGQTDGALRPAIDGGTVYLGGRTLAAVEVAGGRQLWALNPLRPPKRGAGGWGPPAVAGGVVHALDCDALRSLRVDGSQAADPMMVAGVVPPWLPPVVQGNGVWIVESEETGVTGLPRSGQGQPQTYPLSGGQPRSIAASGNRLFVLNHATLLALPVY